MISPYRVLIISLFCTTVLMLANVIHAAAEQGIEMPAAAAAMHGRLAEQLMGHGFVHSAIIRLPELSPQIAKVILKNVPKEVEDLVRRFNDGNNDANDGIFFPVFKGAPGTGKTSLAYALAGSIDAAIIHIQASNLITPYQGSGESTLNNDFEQIFHEAARVRKLIVLIDEIDQVYGYHDERKEEAVMLQFKTLIGKSPKNIMYIGTTNKYESIDPSLLTHITHSIEISYPSRDYYKAIISALLPGANDKVYRCDDALRGEEFLNRFADQLKGISIRFCEPNYLNHIKAPTK